MTREEIMQLNTDYLNGCESEHKMNELFSYVLEQEPCERFEWGRDGKVYKITKAKDGKEICQQVCDDAISREELLKAIDTWDRFGVDDTNSLFRLDNLSLPHYAPYIHYDDVINSIKGMPSVTPQQKYGHCKDCKYFEYDSVGKVDGMPLIVAHEVCTKWGEGCKTEEDGFCFMFEKMQKSEV